MPGPEHEMEDADQAVRSALDAVPDEKWHVLVQLVDELTASGVSTEWAQPESRIEVRDGVEQVIHQSPYPDYAPEVDAVVRALCAQR